MPMSLADAARASQPAASVHPQSSGACPACEHRGALTDLEAGLRNLRDAHGGLHVGHLIDGYERLARHFAEAERDGFYTIVDDGGFHSDALDAAEASRAKNPAGRPGYVGHVLPPENSAPSDEGGAAFSREATN